jgi:hypothetical protein
MITLISFSLLLTMAACDEGSGNGDVSLDSTGSKIERGIERVGNELDTAWTGVKTEAKEVQLQAMLTRIKGMEDIEIEMTPEGGVRIYGNVPSEERKQFAEKIVTETNGVTAVTNQLLVGTVVDSTIGRDTAVLSDTAR